MITILDYGAGNLRSVQNTLDEIGADYTLARDAEGLRRANKIILPGVGIGERVYRARVVDELVVHLRRFHFLLEGLDGTKKMSKSLGNFVGVSEPAADQFGKLMSISDELMARYYELLLGRDLPKDANPFEAKKQLAFEIVQIYHSTGVAEKTLGDWNSRFSDKRLTDAELPEFAAASDEAVGVVAAAYSQAFAIKKSRAEASRLIKQGSVQVDGAKIVDPKSKISLHSGQILRLDKTHAVRIK